MMPCRKRAVWAAVQIATTGNFYSHSEHHAISGRGWERVSSGRGKPASEQPASRDRRSTTAALCGHAPSPLRIFAPEPVFRHQRHPKRIRARIGGAPGASGTPLAPFIGSQGFVACRKLHRGATKGPDQFLLVTT